MSRRDKTQLFPYPLDETDLSANAARPVNCGKASGGNVALPKGVPLCGRAFPPRDSPWITLFQFRGGKTIRGNVVPCCKDCNNAKNNFCPWNGRITSKSSIDLIT